MKFQTLQAFEKHLREAAPTHLSRNYLLIAPVAIERAKITARIVGALQLQPIHYTGTFQGLLETLNTQPLFGGEIAVIYDEVDQLSKAEVEKLAHYLAHPAPYARLVARGSSLKSCPDLYQKGKKETVLIDLSEEKPWERDKRLKEWMAGHAIQAGRVLLGEASELLFSLIGPDLSSLEQEIDKLICYTQGRPRIERRDVESLCASRLAETGWQIAEALVWRGQNIGAVEDHGTLLALIGQVRYHLHIGFQIAMLLQSRQEIAPLFPQLKAPVLEKYIAAARHNSVDNYRLGLLKLFDLEVLAKSTPFSPALLWERFAHGFIEPVAKLPPPENR